MPDIRKAVTFEVRQVKDDRTTPWHVSCHVCGGGPFAYESNVTGVNMAKKTHRDKHAFEVGIAARKPEPLRWK